MFHAYPCSKRTQVDPPPFQRKWNERDLLGLHTPTPSLVLHTHSPPSPCMCTCMLFLALQADEPGKWEVYDRQDRSSRSMAYSPCISRAFVITEETRGIVGEFIKQLEMKAKVCLSSPALRAFVVLWSDISSLIHFPFVMKYAILTLIGRSIRSHETRLLPAGHRLTVNTSLPFCQSSPQPYCSQCLAYVWQGVESGSS